MIISFMRKIADIFFPIDSGLRLMYHKISAQIAVFINNNPSQHMRVIGITGTSGKSTTVELLHFMLESAGFKSGAIGTIRTWIGAKWRENSTMRTSLRPFQTQKLMKEMVDKGIKHCIIEVSSHALAQHRVDGISFDTALITNLYANEHLDYHRTFEHYKATKKLLLKGLNESYRKPNIPKIAVYNADDKHYSELKETISDASWSYSKERMADVQALNIQYLPDKTRFTLKIPNHQMDIEIPLIGAHNLDNYLAAATIALSTGVNYNTLQELSMHIPQIPGRLERIYNTVGANIYVDFSYKPSALEALLPFLKSITTGYLRVVWGPTGNRGKDEFALEQRRECASILHKYADEIIFTNDDPGNDNPIELLKQVRDAIPRELSSGLWVIPDRYEAFRYALMTMQEGDTILLAGRGAETKQWINGALVPFDDRIAAAQILEYADK